MMREAVIVAAVRTPVGKARGCYAYMEPEHLGAIPIRELLARTGFPGGQDAQARKQRDDRRGKSGEGHPHPGVVGPDGLPRRPGG